MPFVAKAIECANRGAGLGLILPQSILVQPYGRPLRERWLNEHLIHSISEPTAFPGVSIKVCVISMKVGMGPGPVPPNGLVPEELAVLPLLPLGTPILRGDLDIIRKIRGCSVRLGEIGLVDTGVVAHMPGGSRERLISDEWSDGLVPYADAKDFFEGRRRWLNYQPDLMHRSKSRQVFEQPKIVIQRIRGKGNIKASIDRTGVFVGHTCTVVQPKNARIPLERILELIQSPVIAAIMKIERGQSIDLYPKEVASFPVPTAWFRDSSLSIEMSLGLTEEEQSRLRQWAHV